MTTPEHLETAECWALLRSSDVGRLAVSIAGEVDIFPINFAVDHGTIVFRMADGSKATGALSGATVAFKVRDGMTRRSTLSNRLITRQRNRRSHHDKFKQPNRHWNRRGQQR